MANLSRNFYNKKVASRNLITTITGIISALLSILVLTGGLTPEQSGELSGHATAIVQGVTGIWGAITAIILMFKATDG